MDRAIDIKRRAQRCIQSGDLPGALAEYEKLIAADTTDPYTYVLLADLLFKMGDHAQAADRYFTAATCYEKAGLYKNGIAVCKKMLRLALAPGQVLGRLATFHALDGLPTEASLYFTQSAEHLVRESRLKEAAAALRSAFEASPDNVRALERLGEVHGLLDDDGASALAFAEATLYYARAGLAADAERCRQHAERLRPGVVAAFEAQAPPPPAPGAPRPVVREAPPVPNAPFREAEVPAGPPRLERIESGTALETDRPATFVPPVGPVDGGMEIERNASPFAAAPAEVPGLVPAEEPAELAVAGPAPGGAELREVEGLLEQAQTEFRAGRLADAARILARAAAAYEAIGRLEEAASIHRSLCRSPHATGEMLERWLANCERRGESGEAAEVACELGDRAYQAGELEAARAWYTRATSLEPGHAQAVRRLSRLEPGDGRAPAEPSAPPTPPAAAEGDGRVQVAVDRGRAVTFDFDSMLAEFQRGVEAQIAGDAQAHYDLAVAYREMGLVEQAVESFRLAARDLNFRQRCSEMIGRCLLDEGRCEEAARALTEALAFAALEPEHAINVRYHLGVALAGSGRPQEALEEFERVLAIDAGHGDVLTRVRELRKHLEAA